MAAISQLHKAKDYESPTSHSQVRNIWKGIKRDENVQVSRVGKSPLLIEEIRRMASLLIKEGNLRALRDRTLIVIGFAGAFRRSELVALNVEDVDIVHEGLIITIRKSKTDQEGHQRKIHLPYGSHVETCPVRTFQEWLNKAGISTGPIFRRVYRRKNAYLVSGERLSDKGVARIIKDTAQKVGLPPAKYAGHSLRSGFITSAAKGGAREDKIMAISGHKSILVMRSYIRDANGFDQNAASYVGL
ncbi:hypothetical protein N007_04725 [Alicyclobacillus acidoterrestris ATCC 49025]|nr:hypothetical protein N007_04725 [Alicyclobacillus acidoterrestris ATCC 49025]